MRLRLAGALLLSAASYFVYLPLPSGVCEPWKLMLLDALFRSFIQAVRHGDGGDRRGDRRQTGGERGDRWERDRRQEGRQVEEMVINQ